MPKPWNLMAMFEALFLNSGLFYKTANLCIVRSLTSFILQKRLTFSLHS